jgi:hypothetical protein
MGKSEIIAKIAAQYGGLGVNCTPGGAADLTVDQELLDVKFLTQKLKLHFESSILVNEAKRVVYYFEKTKEMRAGVGLGFSGESSFQSGKTLFRKVKSAGIGPDGRVYEYEFDIGRLAKIVKTVAAEDGYKMKTVLSRKKASY